MPKLIFSILKALKPFKFLNTDFYEKVIYEEDDEVCEMYFIMDG